LNCDQNNLRIETKNSIIKRSHPEGKQLYILFKLGEKGYTCAKTAYVEGTNVSLANTNTVSAGVVFLLLYALVFLVRFLLQECCSIQLLNHILLRFVDLSFKL